MEEKREARKSNFELLRIVSMFFIVLFHVIVHGNVIQNCQHKGLAIIFEIILLATIVHVNSFVVTTGYFQSKSKFKQSKLWSIIGANWFYKVAIVILFTTIGIQTFSTTEIIHNLFPLNIENYWFITPYLMLYCFSPFLNKLINAMTKRDFQKLLLVFFCLFSLIPYFTGGLTFSNNGFTLYSFVMLYFIGAYLRIYPLEKSHIFKKCSTKLFQIIMLSIFVFCVVLNYSIMEATGIIAASNSILSVFSNGINGMTRAYSNPIIIIQTIAFVSLFSTIDIKSKFINKVSSLTLAVYLIHDNNYVRAVLYKFLKVERAAITSYSFILYVIAIALLIYVSCLIIEFIRQLISKLISKTKLYTKIRTKYYNFLGNIYITD